MNCEENMPLSAPDGGLFSGPTHETNPERGSVKDEALSSALFLLAGQCLVR